MEAQRSIHMSELRILIGQGMKRLRENRKLMIILTILILLIRDCFRMGQKRLLISDCFRTHH
jgi:hypothetical protein